MSALALALALSFAQPAATEGGAAPPPAADAQNWPAGVPHDDYLLVAWCYGALRGYVDLHDQVMPEVTRIEGEFQRPGTTLADDLKVYAQEQVQAKKDLKNFQEALTAAEKASIRPINTLGAQAVEKGHAIWNPLPNTTKARMAEEWMSWTLPALCQTTAVKLKQKAILMGPAFKVNEEAESSAAAAADQPAPPVDKPAGKPADAPPAADKPAEAQASPQ